MQDSSVFLFFHLWLFHHWVSPVLCLNCLWMVVLKRPGVPVMSVCPHQGLPPHNGRNGTKREAILCSDITSKMCCWRSNVIGRSKCALKRVAGFYSSALWLSSLPLLSRIHSAQLSSTDGRMLFLSPTTWGQPCTVFVECHSMSDASVKDSKDGVLTLPLLWMPCSPLQIHNAEQNLVIGQVCVCVCVCVCVSVCVSSSFIAEVWEKEFEPIVMILRTMLVCVCVCS